MRVSVFVDAKTLPGISAPFPDMFDPANFAGGATVKDVRRWRESEVRGSTPPTHISPPPLPPHLPTLHMPCHLFSTPRYLPCCKW